MLLLGLSPWTFSVIGGFVNLPTMSSFFQEKTLEGMVTFTKQEV